MLQYVLLSDLSWALHPQRRALNSSAVHLLAAHHHDSVSKKHNSILLMSWHRP